MTYEIAIDSQIIDDSRRWTKIHNLLYYLII